MSDDDFIDESTAEEDDGTSTPFPFGITDPEEMQEVRDRFARGYRINGGGCWIWEKHCDKDGYGQIKIRGIARRTHRVSYVLNVGPIREGYDIDHVCRVRSCVNPAPEHLEEVTHAVNMARMRASAVHMVPDAQTTPEMVLEWAEEILDQSKNTWYPPDNARWPIRLATEAKWRDVGFEEGFLPEGDHWAVPALYLKAISLGVNPNEAARHILRVNPITAKAWSVNALWAEDVLTAREVGRRVRLNELDERIVDALERKLPGAEYKDIVSLAKAMGERADRKFKPPEHAPALSTGPTINLIGTPEQQAQTALALVKALDAPPIEVEYRDVTDDGT